MTTPDEPSKPRRRGLKQINLNFSELAVDKTLDFILIFVGLYAAIAVQRCQDDEKERQEYVSLLKDFHTELNANLKEEESIEKDLGPITEAAPGKNLGPMQQAFDDFFASLEQDEKVIHCLHNEYATGAKPHITDEDKAACHELYAKFDQSHGDHDVSAAFHFKPAILTPFYRYEVWQLYIANGIKIFKNKELAVRLGEIYNNARLVEKQIADIEATYNDAFMVQVGRSAATDLELAELVHDEEQDHGLSAQGLQALMHVSEAVKSEHAASLEVQGILTLKVERMKNTVMLMHEEIVTIQQALDQEVAKVDP